MQESPAIFSYSRPRREKIAPIGEIHVLRREREKKYPRREKSGLLTLSRSHAILDSDPEHGNLPQQLSDLFDLVHVFRRVAGSVGEHDAVRIRRQNFLRGGGRR